MKPPLIKISLKITGPVGSGKGILLSNMIAAKLEDLRIKRSN